MSIVDEPKRAFAYVARDVAMIAARDLKDFEAAQQAAAYGPITVKIDGVWREVFDVWAEGDDAYEMFGQDSPTAQKINDKIDWASPVWVGVRYLTEEFSDAGNLEDALHFWRTCEPVHVLVPAAATIVRRPAIAEDGKCE